MRIAFGKSCIGQLQFAVADVLQGFGDFAVCGFILPFNRAEAPEIHQRADGDVVNAIALRADFQRFVHHAAHTVADRLRRGRRAVVETHQFGLVAIGGHTVVHRFQCHVNTPLQCGLGGRVQRCGEADVPERPHRFTGKLADDAVCFVVAAGDKQKRCCHQQQRPE